MLRFADLIVEHKEHLGYLETVLNGKEFKFSGHHEPSKAASLFQCTIPLCSNNLIDYLCVLLIFIRQITQGLWTN